VESDPAGGWLRGALELAILAVLSESDRHGYALAQRLAEHGVGQIKGGALYPVLGRLEAAGAVAADWQPGEGGPGRKVYAITPAGRHRLACERDQWRAFAAAFDRMLTTSTEEKS
jgi:PadR family transcriptional regulator PadR